MEGNYNYVIATTTLPLIRRTLFYITFFLQFRLSWYFVFSQDFVSFEESKE